MTATRTTADAEKPIGMTTAALLVPASRGASKTATQTLVRWARRGVLVGKDRVRLEATKRGGVWLTTAAAVRQFLSATDINSDDGARDRTPAKSRRDSVAAGKKLQKLGL
ncbi:MAG TPA: DUF1580 domain-containing protein [Urbifossiella sp.]|nr:DUF1580 domain-containing protein [Urbifossiella sp.]